MAAVYAFFFVQSMITGWYYNKWHGYFYIFAYVVFIIFVFTNEAYHFAGYTE